MLKWARPTNNDNVNKKLFPLSLIFIHSLWHNRPWHARAAAASIKASSKTLDSVCCCVVLCEDHLHNSREDIGVFFLPSSIATHRKMAVFVASVTFVNFYGLSRRSDAVGWVEMAIKFKRRERILFDLQWLVMLILISARISLEILTTFCWYDGIMMMRGTFSSRRTLHGVKREYFF